MMPFTQMRAMLIEGYGWEDIAVSLGLEFASVKLWFDVLHRSGEIKGIIRQSRADFARSQSRKVPA